MWKEMSQMQAVNQQWKILHRKHSPLEHYTASFSSRSRNKERISKSKNARGMADKTPARRSYYNARNRTIEALNSPENDNRGIRVPCISRRANVRPVASQDEDAALALRP